MASLDYQKSVYNQDGKRHTTKRRTTYQLMNHWILDDDNSLSKNKTVEVMSALAGSQGAIVKRSPAGRVSGTGPPRLKKHVIPFVQTSEESPAMFRHYSQSIPNRRVEFPPPKVYGNFKTSHPSFFSPKVPKSPKNGNPADVALVRDISTDPYGYRHTQKVHTKYGKLYAGGYDDYHKTYLNYSERHAQDNNYPDYGPSRLRNGRHGGCWRHVKEVMQAEGKRTVFVDGVRRIEDSYRTEDGRSPSVNLIQSTLAQRIPKQNNPMNTQLKIPYGLRQSLSCVDPQQLKQTEAAHWTLVR